MRKLLLLLCLVVPAFLPARAQLADSTRLLRLDDALRLALQNNYTLQIARNDAAVARNNVSYGNAGYLPTFGFTGRQNYGPSFNGQSQNTVDVTAGVNVNVFDGMAKTATYQRLRAQASLSDLTAEQRTELTAADVITVYFDIARQQQQIVVLQDAVSISEERLSIAEMRLESGLTSELEVRRARVDLNADRAALLRQQTTLVNTRADLDVLTGGQSGISFRVEDNLEVRPDLDLNQLMANAEQNNRSLRLARSGLQVAQLSRRQVMADWLPRLDLQLGYAFTDWTDRLGIAAGRPGGLTYGFTASYDLFDGFNRKRRVRNAELEIRSSQYEIEQTRVNLRADLESAYQNYRNSLDLVALEQENVSMAQQNVDVALERFRQGTITSVDLREVQRALTDVQSRLVSARFEAKRAETLLLRLAGQLGR